jgi:predicted Zn-dependent protease
MNPFLPHDPESRISLVRMAVALALVIALAPLPSYGYVYGSYLTTAEEETLGDEFVLDLKKRFTLIQDLSILDYINDIGQEIVRQHPSPPFTFRFYVVHEDVYNAFAVPGGHVFIYSGLLVAMENEEELAGIVAHEVAHVFCRHISRRIEQSKKIALMTLAGILTGIFLGGSPELAGALTSGSIAAGQSLSLRFSREDERQADQVGLKYLTQAGYSGKGLLEILEKIREKRWFGSEHIPTYVTTHPAIEERMVYLDTWVQGHPRWRDREPKDSEAFHRMRTKLLAQYGEASAARNAFDLQIRNEPENPLGYYGKGLLAGREGNKEEAVRNLKQALAFMPRDNDFLRDLGMTYLKMGNAAQAYKHLVAALDADPQDLEARFLLGKSQIETGDVSGALESLQEVLDKNPEYLPVYYALGEAYQRSGRPGDAHYHLGVYYQRKGDSKNARFHLMRALELASGSKVKKETILETLKEMEVPGTEEAKSRP